MLGDNCIDRYLPPVSREFVGGQAVNVAAGLAGHGVPTAYCGVVGDDSAGQRVVDELFQRGVDIRAVERNPGRTGVTEIASDAGERRFVAEDYGVSAPYRPTAAALGLAARARLVYVAHVADLAALAAALPGSVELAVDASEEPLDRLPLTAIQVLFISRRGLDQAEAQAAGRVLLARGVRLVVITLGCRGATAVSEHEMASQSAPSVEITDTLGAGDAFAAGFLAARLGGHALPGCLASGTEAASEAIGHWGSLPPRHR